MTQEECIALLDRYSNYNGMGIPNLAGCKEAMKKAVELLSVKPSEDLEEAAENYIAPIENEEGRYYINFNGRDIKDAFIAGAEWQKSKMPMPEDTVIFQKGIEEGKRLMIEDAVEGYVNYYEDSGGILMAEAQVGCPYHNGDKVKIVIVKED